jgi:nitroimidazol reductase NimA-like FMN-containing flavoprotein (pyridoxamine 5'-phosphate oxidase superfamily)
MPRRIRSRWLDVVPVRATAIDARGPGVRGPTAVGAVAAGATALGAVAIGRLAIGRASIKRLVIDDLEVKRLRAPGLPGAAALPAEPAARARALLEAQTVMTIATADADGRPSVAPVAFAHDDDFNLYWVSSKTAQHSANIRHRPEVQIVVFREDPTEGVYVDARAAEIDDPDEVERAIALLNARDQPTKFEIAGPADVSDDAAWRIYKATRVETTIRSDETEQGQAVTVRKPVQI